MTQRCQSIRRLSFSRSDDRPSAASTTATGSPRQAVLAPAKIDDQAEHHDHAGAAEAVMPADILPHVPETSGAAITLTLMKM